MGLFMKLVALLLLLIPVGLQAGAGRRPARGANLRNIGLVVADRTYQALDRVTERVELDQVSDSEDSSRPPRAPRIRYIVLSREDMQRLALERQRRDHAAAAHAATRPAGLTVAQLMANEEELSSDNDQE